MAQASPRALNFMFSGTGCHWPHSLKSCAPLLRCSKLTRFNHTLLGRNYAKGLSASGAKLFALHFALSAFA